MARKRMRHPDTATLIASGKVSAANSIIPPEKSERTTALQYADKMFSRWIRIKAANTYGYVHCFICGTALPWEEAVAMHCEPRLCMSTRFDEVNVQAGCALCNGKPLGDRENFRLALDARFGPGTAERNTMKSKVTEKMGSEYLLFLGDTYAQRMAELSALLIPKNAGRKG